MPSRLSDLRLLYLAMRIEDSFEKLERAYERHLPDGPARAALQPIFQDGPAHADLKRAFERLTRTLEAEHASIPPAELLAAILECEQTAERFYASHARDLTDPVLAALFTRLAQEEARHGEAVRVAAALAPA